MRKETVILGCLLVVAFLVPSQVFAWGGPKTYTMQKGDTLWELAAKNYGDPTLYPVFLEVNSITNVRSIPVGKTIIIPSLSDIQKVSRELDPDKRKDLIKNLQGSSGSSGSSGSLDRPLLGGGSTGSGAGSASNPSGYVPSDGPLKVSFQDVLEGPRVKGEFLNKVETRKK